MRAKKGDGADSADNSQESAPKSASASRGTAKQTTSKRSTAKTGSAKKAPRTVQPLAYASEPATLQREVTEAEIRARAYEMYLSRGGTDGDPVADWLAAEQQIRGEGGAGLA